MATVTLNGTKLHTFQDLPEIGTKAPDFFLTTQGLSDVQLSDFHGYKTILNIFPSIDTPVCSASVRKFNEEITRHRNTKVLCISRDLPFAMSRFCGAEGLKNVVTLSDMRNSTFGDKYGVKIMDGPLAGLFARAIVILDEENKVIYTELVPAIEQEPDYQKALEHL